MIRGPAVADWKMGEPPTWPWAKYPFHHLSVNPLKRANHRARPVVQRVSLLASGFPEPAVEDGYANT
ncbi:MAG: hypothetical protein EBZ78_07360 [Verrucomicrobia bacterium]|nr:hypothetical protein [Verrucomicrobiota bacterium]